jgi:thymidylate synthase
MLVINARNVNDAFIKGMALLKSVGVPQSSRAGEVLVAPCPVTTVYERPTERVLFHVGRDANPFFHLMESLWMLAGRNDATWLDQFVGDFSKRFAEEGGIQHGAYGFRWRKHFDMEGGGGTPYTALPDQLNTIVQLLLTNPDDRRVVLQMWDPVSDLGTSFKDIPCNTQAYFRVRKVSNGLLAGVPSYSLVLDMTVCCRSNDAVWGAYGANAVHFSVLQEYIAARAHLEVGTYYQVSNNFHVYTNVLDKIDIDDVGEESYGGSWATPLVSHPEVFDFDLRLFFSGTPASSGLYTNTFFPHIAIPMKEAYALWRAKKRTEALQRLAAMPAACDWRVASDAWMKRRMVKSETKSEEGVAR